MRLIHSRVVQRNWGNLGSGALSWPSCWQRPSKQPQMSQRTVIGTDEWASLLSVDTEVSPERTHASRESDARMHGTFGLWSAKRKTLIFTMHVGSVGTPSVWVRWNQSRVCAAANPAASRNHISPLVTSCYIMLIFAHSTKPCSFVLGVALIVSDVSRARKSFPPRWAGTTLHTRLLMDCARALSP